MNVFFSSPEKPAALVQEAAPETGTVAAALSVAPHESAIASLLETAENTEQKRRIVERVYSIIGTALTILVAVSLSGVIGSIYFPVLPGQLLIKCSFAWLAVNTFIQTVSMNFRGVAPTQQRNTIAALLHFPQTPAPFAAAY